MTAAVALSPSSRTLARRGAFWLVAAALVAVITAIVVASTGGVLSATVALDPDSTAADGARAVVQVLDRNGVTVSTPDGLDAARAAAAAGSTVLLYDPANFLTAEQAASLAASGDSFVLVDPAQSVLDAFVPTVAFAGAPADDGALDASCDYPPAERAVTIPSSGSAYRDLGGANTEACFPTGDDAFALLRVDQGGRSVTVVGDAEVLSNDGITAGGRAALALGLLSERAELAWYIPVPADVIGSGELGLAELTPGWVTPAVLLLFAAAAAAAVWRGRRFGPLVAEALPVVVHASETAEGRARLYARNSARLRALDALRIGSTGRLSALLGLSRTASLDDVARAAAALLGRDPAPVYATLVGEIPESDAALVRLSDELLLLERAVTAAIAATGTTPSAPNVGNPEE